MSRVRHIILQVVLTIVAFTMGMILPVSAHKSSDSYLGLRLAGPEVVGQWDIALRDLDYVLNLDTNYDGIVTWGELRARHAPIAEAAVLSGTYVRRPFGNLNLYKKGRVLTGMISSASRFRFEKAVSVHEFNSCGLSMG
jgi:hypothetical protein